MLPFTLAGRACVQKIEIPVAVRKHPNQNKRISRSLDQREMLLSLLTEKHLGDIDFSPTWNIRREPEYMEGDKTDVIYNFYDDTAQ